MKFKAGLRTGRGASGVVLQHIYSAGGTRMAPPEIRPNPDLVKTGNTQGVMIRSEEALVAATGGHVNDFGCVGKVGNTVWERARIRLQDYFRGKMWESVNFIQCGIGAEHSKDGGLLLS